MGIKKWLGGKWKLLKHSKFFLFVLGLVIGATYFYCYAAGKDYYEFAVIGYSISMIHIDEARVSTNRQDMDKLVSADLLLGDSSKEAETPEALISKYDWDTKIAIAIMKAESQGDCTRVGDKHLAFWKDGIMYGQSYGCMQIRFLEGRPEPEELLNPEKNINYAYQIYQRRGWNTWSVFQNNSYLNYL